MSGINSKPENTRVNGHFNKIKIGVVLVVALLQWSLVLEAWCTPRKTQVNAGATLSQADSRATERLEQLKQLLHEYNDAYYNQDAPQVSDAEYDALYRELVQLEARYPQWVTPDSPTQHVGGQASPQFAPVLHPLPMYSLNKVYASDKLRDWEQRVKATLKKQGIDKTLTYVVEPKFDGLAISCRYENGRLVEGSTRGDGHQGENVLRNLMTIPGIPQQLHSDKEMKIPMQLEIRGEVVMPVPQFEALNRQLQEEGNKPWATPRNAAAGSLRQKDPAITQSRKLDAVFYTGLLPESELNGIKTHWDMLDAMDKLGFRTSPQRQQCETMACVEAYIQNWEKQRNVFPIATDGVVVKVDDLSLQQVLGYSQKAPNWAIAFKYQPESAETVVQSVEFQQGRTGRITPVAIVQPVVIDGTTISRVNLHSMQQLQQKDIRIGDTVRVHKAGEIIPEILSVDLAKRPPQAKAPAFPSEKSNTNTTLLLQHWVQRDAMAINGLGPHLLEALTQSGHVITPADLYALRVEDLMRAGQLNRATSEKIYGQINSSKQQPYAKVLFSLGIPQVGKTTAVALSQQFLKIDDLMHATLAELQTVPGIGLEGAKQIFQFFQDAGHVKEIERLKQSGLNL